MIGAGRLSPEGCTLAKCSAKRSGSIVAEVMITFRSGRWGRIWRRYQDHVDVQRPFVRLVDDDRVIARQQAIAADLGQQDAVGHELQPSAAPGLTGEADLEADAPLPQLLAELARDALGHGAGRDPARL